MAVGLGPPKAKGREAVLAGLRGRDRRAVEEYILHLERRIEHLEGKDRAVAGEIAMNSGILEANFKILVTTLRGVDHALRTIREGISSEESAIETVSATSEELTRSSDSILDQMVNQSASLEEFSSVVEEMTANIQSVAHLSDDSKRVSDEVATLTRNSTTAVARSLEMVQRVATASGQIKEIVVILSAIAGRSNLLAMNAAIEAAHAGDVGRGFAVVAEEMRNMADDSNREAKKIQTIVAEIIKSIDEANEATGAVIQGNEQIVQKIVQSNQITTQIKDAMQEQAAGTTQVLRQARTLTDGTDQTKGSAEEQRVANEGLLQTIVELQRVADEVRRMLDLQENNRNEIMDITNKIGRIFVRSVGLQDRLLEDYG